MFKYFTHTNTKSTVGLLILFTSVVFTTVIAGDTWEYINPNGTGSVFQHVQNDDFLYADNQNFHRSLQATKRQL